MNKLTRTQEIALIDCLRALEAGATIEHCLARFPQHASALGPHLELRARLLAIEAPQPPAAAYDAGRQALLARLAAPSVASRSSRWAALRASLVTGWPRSPLPRVAAAAALVLALAGGAVGASAAAGVDRAQDVLSALHVVAPAGQGDQQNNPNADEGAANQDDGIGNAPAASENGQQNSDDHAADGGDNATAADEHPPCLPGGLLDRVPPLQDLFSACPQDSALPGQTPTPSEDGPGAPNNSGLDHRPVTPPHPNDAQPQSEEHQPGPPTSGPTARAPDADPHSNVQPSD